MKKIAILLLVVLCFITLCIYNTNVFEISLKSLNNIKNIVYTQSLPEVKHDKIPEELQKFIPKNGQVILIDYTKSCNKKRLWVVQNNKVVINCRVGHGKNSGWNTPTKFSNKIGSNKSCIGKFITSYEYTSSVIGRAMVIHGLDKGVNDNANVRGIRFHSSDYATDSYFKLNGRIGRSLGCFTTDKKYNDQIINICKFGTIVYVIG